MSDEGLIALLPRALSSPLRRRMFSASLNLGELHLYISSNAALNSFFGDSHVFCRKPGLAVRRCKEASQTVLSLLFASEWYSAGFQTASERSLGERRGGSPLCVQTAPHCLRGLSHAETHFVDAQNSTGLLTGKLLYYGRHIVQRSSDDLNRCLGDLANGLCESGSTGMDTHKSQMIATASDARTQAVEMTGASTSFELPFIGVGACYNHGQIHAFSDSSQDKRRRKRVFE